MPDLQEMLLAARHVDATITERQVIKTAAMVAAVAQGAQQALPGVHPSKLVLIDDNEDPFGGNVNNRNVAKRIAAQRVRVYDKNPALVHSGDPAKAAADIRKSELLAPEAEVDDSDKLPEPIKATPTPGSPAAEKQATAPIAGTSPAGEAAMPANAPPTWRPNA